MTGYGTPTPPAQPMTRRELEAKIVAKAWRDPSFKALLLSDPKAALQYELTAIDPGIRLPPALEVHVHEESPNSYHLVLPRNPKDISLGEVVGDDLEAIAPQTIAVLVVGIAVVAGNTVVAGNNVANVNAAVNGNVTVNGNVLANANAIGS
jgi:hypothetical protein